MFSDSVLQRNNSKDDFRTEKDKPSTPTTPRRSKRLRSTCESTTPKDNPNLDPGEESVLSHKQIIPQREPKTPKRKKGRGSMSQCNESVIKTPQIAGNSCESVPSNMSSMETNIIENTEEVSDYHFKPKLRSNKQATLSKTTDEKSRNKTAKSVLTEGQIAVHGKQDVVAASVRGAKTSSQDSDLIPVTPAEEDTQSEEDIFDPETLPEDHSEPRVSPVGLILFYVNVEIGLIFVNFIPSMPVIDYSI